MASKLLLVVGKKDSFRIQYLKDLLATSYEMLHVESFDAFSNALEERYYDYISVIIDNPSKFEKAEDYISLVSKKNSYMLCLPVLMLTDDENIAEDEKFLNDVVVGIIKPNDTLVTVKNRIDNASKLAGSMSFEEFSKILANLPSLIYLKDANGHYAFASHYWNHLDRGDDPEWNIRGKTDLDIRKDQANAKLAMDIDKEIIKNGKGIVYTIKEKGPDDELQYFQVIKEPIRNENGQIKGIVAILNDITEQELLKEQLRIKSITDPLTGLYNRLFLTELVSPFMTGNGGTIITADCDGLKQINDKYGHSAGDEYILLAARLLQETLPKDSYLFRIGGDEFLALLPGVRATKAKKYVDLIMENAKNFRTNDFALEISAGYYSTSVNSHQSMDKCIVKSDRNMYQAKQLRRAQRAKKK